MVRNCNKGGGKCIGDLGREGKGREVALRSFILCTEGVVIVIPISCI